MTDLKIGDEVYIHGLVDEVSMDTVIIKNEGGYFGTVAEEIIPSAQPESAVDAEFWRERADYYSDMCSKLIADMGAGVKIEAVKIDETGITFTKKKPSAQEIVRCKDCKYSDENWRRVSVRWLPCMDMRTGSNWFCGSAERRNDE